MDSWSLPHLGMLILKVSELFTFEGWESLVSATTEASQASRSISIIFGLRLVRLGQSRVGCPAMIGSPTAPHRWYRCFRSGKKERGASLESHPAPWRHHESLRRLQVPSTPYLPYQTSSKEGNPETQRLAGHLFTMKNWTYPRIASSLLGCQPSPGDPPVKKRRPPAPKQRQKAMAWD